MSVTSSPLRSDNELLLIARTVLQEQGFHVEAVSKDIDLVLAENRYFVVAVAATSTLRELILAEPVAFDVLAQRTESASLGPKKWDTYLVLLTQERSSEDDVVTRELYAINYDTSRLRRIAHAGVDPTPDAVRHALAPFIEPAVSASAAVEADPLVALLRSLVSRGVDPELAERAVTAFGQGGVLDDVL